MTPNITQFFSAPRRPVRLCRLLGVVVVALVATNLATAAGASPSSALRSLEADGPTAVINVAEDAATTAGTVHFVDITRSGKEQEALVGTISAANAQETISNGGTPLQVMLVSSVAYVSGSADVLEGSLSLPDDAAKADAGKWISLQPSDGPFDTVVGALSISNALDSYLPGKAHFGKVVKLHGQAALAITGVPPEDALEGAQGSLTLFVSVASPHVPVAATLVLARGKERSTEEVAYSDWGAPVHVTAPSGAIPYSSIPQS